ncbi:DUF397 domain-containing protein [Streptomyces sp. SM12]|uniref:DUF397 domain-containing protein n=1 Tax=Streptomyces sp. SM12 TaxID=1071602 RepID=UPI000CD4D92C|nr:DUF397 domain-containing protein [Streptomyces sp. SM12]
MTEQPVHWTKSSYSAGGNECVETAALNADAVGIRDSKDPASPIIRVRPAAFARFVTYAAAPQN